MSDVTRRAAVSSLLLGGAVAGTSAKAQQTPLSAQGQADFSRVLSPTAPPAGLSPQADRRTLAFNGQLTIRLAHNPAKRLETWNEIALELTAMDHARGPSMKYDHLGPHRSSRAMAIVHLAMYDAVNAITKKYKTYSGIADGPGQASIDMAIAVAARDALLSLFDLQKQKIGDAFQLDQARIPGTDEVKMLGMEVGARAAKAIIDLRIDDNANIAEPDFGSKEQSEQDPVKFVFVENLPGLWQPDPISNIRTALGYHWGKVKPFVLKDAAEFRPKAPPATNTPEYSAYYNEIKRLGGDSSKGTPTSRKDFETFKGIFWAYDGTPGLCAPPRLYNQVAMQVAEQNSSTRDVLKDVSELSRFLALVNVAMADAAISAWEAKWHYKYWRPITAVTFGGDDGNPATERDASFYPLGAPASNARGPNFTPPFPAYPSGHAAFGGALFEVLRAFWDDHTSFVMVSDEFNGLNKGMGTEDVREKHESYFVRLSDAEWENARSRIWLGIHWQVDADAGVEQGNAIAKQIISNAFQRR